MERGGGIGALFMIINNRAGAPDTLLRVETQASNMAQVHLTEVDANGVSWWLLDEPNHHDDYRALCFFGWLGKRWLKEFPDVPMVFRTDISYVEFIRDQIAGIFARWGKAVL